ncbi:hypothetical protein [Tumebacillus permanentifrigoris]|uniref:Uncharacterized protein n=1 Tax=Tumebacillus permanentifrigoris TaxID=378543 RepID=A0A316D909_9BACL|nr:hypothetical protein [Tumebacillus permanentifrigoris]PWK13459.1 hypothetical protein C7459_107127 [Tumebacillus permanentifrigoris]
MRDALTGFRDRMKNMAGFWPLFRLRELRKYQEFDLLALGLGVLLLILEHMLIGRVECDHADVARFLRIAIQDAYGQLLSEEESRELATYLLAQLRNDGRAFEFQFRNLESSVDDKHAFHLIENGTYHVASAQIRFKLSDVGLDLLFKTREMYKELRISISQMLLRQQIEKGVFDDALRTVDSLGLDVRQLREELERMKMSIKRDVSQFSLPTYEAMLSMIREQFDKERQMFEELNNLIRDTRDNYETKTSGGQEEMALNRLVEVSQRLNQVINLHNKLLVDKLDLQELVLEALEEGIVSGFRSKVNFEREFLDPIVTSGTKLENVRRLIEPLMSLNIRKRFNVHKAFASQPVQKVVEEKTTDAPDVPIEQWQLSPDDPKLKLKNIRDARYKDYLRMIFEPLLHEQSLNLHDILNTLEPEQLYDVVNARDFYPFLVQLHQMSPMNFRLDAETKAKILDSDETNLPYLLVQLIGEQPEYEVLGTVMVEVEQEGDRSLSLAQEEAWTVSNFRFYKEGLYV